MTNFPSGQKNITHKDVFVFGLDKALSFSFLKQNTLK